MSYEFLQLNREHNSELLELFSLADSGSNSFSIQRGRDFFALTDTWGEARYYGVLKNGNIAAVAGVTNQHRYINGRKEKILYFHDLRMHPVHGNAIAYYRLAEGIKRTYENDPAARYAFSIVLDANPNRKAIAGAHQLFGEAGCIGSIVHTGFPLFTGSAGSPYQPQEISADEAWSFYEPRAKQHQYAFAEEPLFKIPNGIFLGTGKNGQLEAVAKIADQSAYRQIIAMKDPSFPQKLINAWCRLKGATPLPSKGDAFRHCYLSFYMSDNAGHRIDFIAWARKHCAKRYSYIFCGLQPGEAQLYRDPLMIRFRSNVFSYGNAAIPFEFPELTLI